MDSVLLTEKLYFPASGFDPPNRQSYMEGRRSVGETYTRYDPIPQAYERKNEHGRKKRIFISTTSRSLGQHRFMFQILPILFFYSYY